MWYNSFERSGCYVLCKDKRRRQCDLSFSKNICYNLIQQGRTYTDYRVLSWCCIFLVKFTPWRPCQTSTTMSFTRTHVIAAHRFTQHGTNATYFFSAYSTGRNNTNAKQFMSAQKVTEEICSRLLQEIYTPLLLSLLFSLGSTYTSLKFSRFKSKTT